jgi:hypothetical protein
MTIFIKNNIERGETWATLMGLVVYPEPLSILKEKLHGRKQKIIHSIR